MRPVVVVDTSLLAVPNYAQSFKEAQLILETINLWAAAAEGQNCCCIAVSSDAVGTLEDANCFPATQNIQALLEMFQLEHVFSARDIKARIFSLITRAERLVQLFGAEVAKVEHGSAAEIDFSKGTDPALVDSTHAALSTVALLGEKELVRVVLGFPWKASPLTYSADILTVRNEDEGEVVFSPPKHVEAIITPVRIPEEFLKSLDPKELWQKAETDLEIHMAVSLEIARMASWELHSLPPKAGTPFCLGTNFYASLSRYEAASSGKFAFRVLETCAQVVLGICAGEISDFGEVRHSDRATSHRVHVSKRGIGLRLMFWRRSSGLIEFANIGPKHELRIEGGDCRVTTRAHFSN
jgi:hypothetical protein